MNNTTFLVSPYAGRTFQLWVDFNHVAVEAEDVTSVSYTVYRVRSGVRTAVEGHTSVTVPTSCFITPTEDTHSGEDYNFEHRISAAEVLPFAEPSTDYLVVYTFLFVDDADPRVCEIWCRTGGLRV